jgi:transmembrane sensor
LVTEGRVQIEAASAGGTERSAETPIIEMGQRAVVPLGPAATARTLVSSLSAKEVDERLAWQPRLLDFNGQPLSVIVATFNRHNPLRLLIADTSLSGIKLSAAFRSDNVAGFVRLMEAEFGMRAEWRGDNEIALSRAR